MVRSLAYRTLKLRDRPAERVLARFVGVRRKAALEAAEDRGGERHVAEDAGLGHDRPGLPDRDGIPADLSPRRAVDVYGGRSEARLST